LIEVALPIGNATTTADHVKSLCLSIRALFLTKE